MFCFLSFLASNSTVTVMCCSRCPQSRPLGTCSLAVFLSLLSFFLSSKFLEVFRRRFPLSSSVVDKIVLSPARSGHVEGACTWMPLKGWRSFPHVFFF